MLTKDDIIKVLREKLPYLNSEFGVRRIGLFGSYSVGNPNENSDLDIIAEFEKPIGFRFVEFAEYIEQLFDKKTDILTPAGVNAIRNKQIADEIERTIVYV